MQQKEIKYTGITTIPSDYDCPDGDIASMMNLVNENGNLVPVNSPKILFLIGDNQKILHIHKTSDYCNYILYDTNEGEANGQIYYFSKTPAEAKPIISIAGKQLFQINSIGNTLVILTSEGLVYALYKSGHYEILGSNPPFPSISFRLKGGIAESKSFDINFNSYTRYYDTVFDQFGGIFMLKRVFLDSQTSAETIYANINPLAQQIKEAGAFQYDFMLRYAYKLYDGKLHMCSVPIYMNAGNGAPFFLLVNGLKYVAEIPAHREDETGRYRRLKGVKVVMSQMGSRLDYQIENIDEVIKELKKWEDLIEEIRIFVTPPLRYMDPEFKPGVVLDNSTFVYPSAGEINSSFTMCTGVKDETGKEIHFKSSYPREFLSQENRYIPLLIKDNGGEGIYNFHHIATIKIKDIKRGEQVLPIERGALSTLANRELMEVDLATNYKLIARNSFVYNSRLNIANVYSIPTEYPLESCIQYVNGIKEQNTYSTILYSFKAYVLIESSDTNVLITETSSLKLYTLGNYFFYPNTNALKVIVERTDNNGNKTYASTKLDKHEQISGAYTSSLSNGYEENFDLSLIENTTRGFYYPNKIYTSEANNPFSFPDTGVNLIGSGEIRGISSATKALSQGQFGQFPLYAFTSEGIWALEVSAEGKFIAKQPMTRDVCNNPESITQIDTSVLFTSERGIMLIQGSESICISDVLNEKSFDISQLKGHDQLTQMIGLTIEHFKHSNFMEYTKSCNMTYDYINQRIIVFNKTYSYAYVYSLQSKTWGMIPSDFSNSINSYPDSYIMTKNNTLVNISNAGHGETRSVKGIIITRPLKLDSPDILKTITQSIHRGIFNKGKIKTVLYGSRDCINFAPIASSADHTLRSIHGSPYKYFRFAIIAELAPGESISGTSIIFETKQTNKLR